MRRLAVLIVILAGVAAVHSWQAATERRELAAARRLLDDSTLRLVILGDSVARGTGDERGLGIGGWMGRQMQATIANLGIDGARTYDVRRMLARRGAQLRTADVIVISIGGNDLYGDSVARLLAGLAPTWRQRRTVAKVEHLVASVRELNPAARIYLLGLYNPYRQSSLAAWLDRQVNLWDSRLIARFAASRGVTVIRICDLFARGDRISPIDRFHPGASGYAAIAARLASAM